MNRYDVEQDMNMYRVYYDMNRDGLSMFDVLGVRGSGAHLHFGGGRGQVSERGQHPPWPTEQHGGEVDRQLRQGVFYAGPVRPHTQRTQLVPHQRRGQGPNLPAHQHPGPPDEVLQSPAQLRHKQQSTQFKDLQKTVH